MNKVHMKYFKGICALILLLCLLPMPYGYYVLVRYLTMIGFAIFAYDYFQRQENAYGYICVVVALLFQPFVKIVLGRGIWNIVDVAVAMALIASIIYDIYDGNKMQKGK